MFSRNASMHTLLHGDILKILHRLDMLSEPPSQSSALNLYLQTSHLGRGSPRTKTQFAWSAPLGFAIWLPYMDMYFPIWGENPKSD